MKFKINNQLWEIVELSQKQIREVMMAHNDEPAEKGRYFGVTYEDIQKIYLDKDLCTQRKRFTLIHEVAHCYISAFMCHAVKEYDEEGVCDIVSNSHDIIHDIVDKYFKWR